MKIRQSKKELFRDNVKMNKELIHLTAVNSELTIQLEQQNELIDEINAKNIKIMEKFNNDINKY